MCTMLSTVALSGPFDENRWALNRRDGSESQRSSNLPFVRTFPIPPVEKLER
jgi:hypothetical protein